MTLTFLFVYCFLFVHYYSKILLQLCQLCAGHFIAVLLLYQTPESDKDTSLHRPDDAVAMFHNKQLIDIVQEGV